MRKLICSIFAQLLLLIASSTKAKSLPPTIEAAPGQSIILDFGSAEPTELDIHENSKTRYASFNCRKDHKNPRCTCKLSVKKRAHATSNIVFSIFSKGESNKEATVHAYVKIVPNDQNQKGN